MIVTIKDFIDWRSAPVTKAIFAELDKRIQDVAGELAISAGIEPTTDRYRAGYIQGLRDAMSVDAEEVEGAGD